jgi:phosphoribosylformimino-5-aminoimidazole carboxamide ribotide isomerase
MRIIPVMDLWRGAVVYGTGGCRVKHRPITVWATTLLTTSSDPLAVAEGFRTHFGLTELYLADLDALDGAAPALPLYQALQSQGFRLWVDAGVGAPAQALALADAGIAGIVVGLTTLTDPAVLPELCRECGDRVVFSLGPKDGQPLDENPLDKPSARDVRENYGLAVRAITAGARRLIVPALAPVEDTSGAGTFQLCQELVAAYPQVEVVAGGDVYKVPDLPRLRQIGVGAVLSSLALHDGRLRREDLSE